MSMQDGRRLGRVDHARPTTRDRDLDAEAEERQAASRMIALATPNVARTASELMMFGSRCRNRIPLVAHADHAGRRDELRFAQTQQLTADEPARAGPAEQADDRDHGAGSARRPTRTR